MTDELIDILNDDLSYQKTALKSEAHKYGWLHASVHIWFYTENNELLFQKRSPTKIAFPNVWDVSVAGHIGSGESAEKSAIREVEEEIGIKINSSNLISMGIYHEKHKVNDTYLDNEIHYLYKCLLTTPIEELTIRKEELTALKLIPISYFEKILKSPLKEFAQHPLDYYQKIIKLI